MTDMRMLLRSLFGRLTLALLVGLVLAQLLSASILLRDRGQTLYRSIRAQLVERTAGIVQLLDALTPVERRRLLPLLSTPEAPIHLANVPAGIEVTDVDGDDAADVVEQALRERLRARYEVRVALWDAVVADRRPRDMAAMHLKVVETARAFNTMQRRIRSYIEDRARILAAVSHDVKTPLTRLRLRSDLLDDEELRDRIQADLDDMESMVSATLEFMRGSESREESRQLDLMALLESIRDNAYDVGWRVSLAGAVGAPVLAHPLALKRCITNLVENGVSYGGEVEVTVHDDGRQVRIDVKDRGPGIPNELMERVFDPFFRIESSRARHTGGAGLGLGISRNIARAHGGDLILRNRDGGGLCAELTLPR